jgi:lysyl-tRNA synthetase class 2
VNPDILQIRARVLQVIRAFFAERGYLEVDTPMLAPNLIPESHLEVFRTEFVHPDHSAQELYLTPSPEVWIKRLLAEGSGSVFQLGKSFRNGEALGRLHAPEFTMLEYYTVDADYMDSIRITEELFHRLLATGREGGVRGPLADYRAARGNPESPAAVVPPFLRMSVSEAFARYADESAQYVGEIEALHGIARRHGMRTRPEETYEELFNRLFVHLVEPELPADRPVVLYDYPAAIPTLAARKPDTPWSERWELYLGGVEVANCYTEERNPERIRHFFASESAHKARAMVPHAVDHGYHEVFRENFPYCSGVAMGVDRILMVLLGERSITRVMPFSVLD